VSGSEWAAGLERLPVRVRLLAGKLILHIEDALPDDRRCLRVTVSVRDRTFKSYAFRWRTGVACPIPAPEASALGLQVGEEVTCQLSYRSGPTAERIPPDVSEAISSAGVSLSNVAAHERRQLLLMVGESRTPEIRARRIALLTAACSPDGEPGERETESGGAPSAHAESGVR
jgi:hypothetical protein